MSNTYLLYPTTSTDLALVGGKARALAALVNADLPIPAWFVLSPEAFTASLSPEQRVQLADAQDSEAALAVLTDVHRAGDPKRVGRRGGATLPARCAPGRPLFRCG